MKSVSIELLSRQSEALIKCFKNHLRVRDQEELIFREQATRVILMSMDEIISVKNPIKYIMLIEHMCL